MSDHEIWTRIIIDAKHLERDEVQYEFTIRKYACPPEYLETELLQQQLEKFWTRERGLESPPELQEVEDEAIQQRFNSVVN